MKSPGAPFNRTTASVFAALVCAAVAACGGDGGSDAGLSQSPISVNTPADLGTIQPGATAQVAAIVNNDSANRGVRWTLSCPAAPCGIVSPTATANGSPTTYTAPPAPRASNLVVTLTATSLSNTAVAASSIVTVSGVTVVIDPPGPVDVLAATTTRFTAMVNSDPTNKGVTWLVRCSATDCGSVSPSTSATGVTVTYTSPAIPPPAALTVTIVASSVSTPSVLGSASVNVAANTVAVAPVTALIPLGTTQQFTAVLGSDPSASVVWTLTQNGIPCPNVCGTLSPSLTANGTSSTYTAPRALPANASVTLTATSVIEPTKWATSTVVLTAGNVKLIPTVLSFLKIKMKNLDCCVPPPQTARLTNTGNSALKVGGITIVGATPTAFSQTNTCGNSVPAGGSCDITVHFFAKGNYYSAEVSIGDSSSDSPQLIHLIGTVHYEMTAGMRTALARQTTAALPPPSGSNRVGTRVMHLVDSKRTDPFLANGARRELMMRLWYPAPTSIACVAADYTSPQVWNYFAELVGVSLPQVSTNSCLNAPITAGRHPVVVVSHGFTGTFTDYSFLAEDLASRGYVVASMSHTYEATAVEFPDGRLEKSLFGSHLTNYTRSDAGALAMAVSVRLADLRFVVDELERLNGRQDSGFVARLDMSRIGLVGHSLGGLATLRALETEPRFKAGVLLDSIMPPRFDKPLMQPVMTLVVGRERWNEDDCQLWGALRGPRLAENFPGAEHIALSDAVWLLKGNISTGSANPGIAIAAIREHVAAFLETHLAGQTRAATPNTPAPSDLKFRVATQAQSLCSSQ
jgi:pimeloyl-ACP methyl ester carboxylesterase